MCITFSYLTHSDKLNINTSKHFPSGTSAELPVALFHIPKRYFVLPLRKPSNLSVPLSTINCLHTIQLVGMETKHGWGGGDHRCSCLDSGALECVYSWMCLSFSQDKFHHWHGRLPQGRFIYFRRPDAFTWAAESTLPVSPNLPLLLKTPPSRFPTPGPHLHGPLGLADALRCVCLLPVMVINRVSLS